MADVQRSSFPEGMKAELYDYILDQDEFEMEKSFIPEICEMKTSDKAYVKRTSVIGDDDLDEREEGEEIQEVSMAEGYTVYAKMRSFAKKIPVTKEVVRDHQKLKNFMKDIIPGWMNAAQRTKDKFVAKHINEGGKTAGNAVFNQSIAGGVLDDSSADLLYDSEPLFNLTGDKTNRQAKATGSTFYNAIASDATEANFETLWQLMTVTNAKNEDETEVTIIPNIVLCGGGQIAFKLQRILESALQSGNANNDVNVLKDLVRVVSSNYFTDTDAWSLMVAKKGMIFYLREAPEIDLWEDKDRKKFKASIEVSFGLMIPNWRYFAGSNHATS